LNASNKLKPASQPETIPKYSMPNFGFLSPRPKATRVMFGVSTAAVLASGLPTVDDEDRGKLREGLVDEKNEKRLRKKSWV
jgi:hypothetical protein